MDIQQPNQQSISDDQELAKVLAGVSDQADDNSIQYEETAAQPAAPAPSQPVVEPAQADETPVVEEEAPEVPEPQVEVPEVTPAPGDSSLEGIKKEALNELRPLVDKLNVSPDEKFDTYLLLLRSTDDRELIAPAHEAAQQITDEAKKAQALLDIIKEIDFLSQPQK